MNNMTRTHTQHGFTLIEAMVALVIFSVGLLGLAGMQMAGMQSNHSAMMRTIATQHSYSMAEKIRSRKADLPVWADDLDGWNALLGNALPSGAGTVTAMGGGSVRMTVRWDEDRSGAVGTGCDAADPLDLKCLRLTIFP